MTVQFGIFDHLDQRPEAPRQTFADRIEFIKAAEAAGFRTYHLAEHHCTPLGMAPSPGIFLAAVAQVTSTIRLGPLVYLLPLYNPLRLIEEICMLDHLSDGRFEVGVGRGISPIEVGFLGVDAEEAPAIYLEALDVIRGGLTSDRLTHHGRYFDYDDVPMALRPLQDPVPFWSASMSPAGLETAARFGMHCASLGAISMVRDAVDGYLAASSKHGTMTTEPPLMGMHRIVVVAASEGAALEIARPAYGQWFDKLAKLWRERGVEIPIVGPIADFEVAHELGAVVAGSPAQVTETLAAQIEATGVNYLLTELTFGDMAHADEMASLELFAAKVKPALEA
jgi:alkanesulfonate monooxygenase SsuD/methylene tetrahydromethanopterin reductase-like flavin-dependent oxidoreductase (luciferase family)